MLIYCLIHAQLILNKRMMPNKRQRKEEVRAGLDVAAFPLHRPLGVVGILLSLYITIYQHYIIYIQQFNRISQAFQQSFGHGVIPAHSLAWLIASLASIHVGGIGKPVGCRGQFPALLHHFPHLRLLRLDLRTQQQGGMMSCRQNDTVSTSIFAMMSSSKSAISISRRLRLLRIIFRKASVSICCSENHIRLLGKQISFLPCGIVGIACRPPACLFG